jgi:hypothetical protein
MFPNPAIYVIRVKTRGSGYGSRIVVLANKPVPFEWVRIFAGYGGTSSGTPGYTRAFA